MTRQRHPQQEVHVRQHHVLPILLSAVLAGAIIQACFPLLEIMLWTIFLFWLVWALFRLVIVRA